MACAVCFGLMVILAPLQVAGNELFHSKYAGQEEREIKSLSLSNIEALQNGKGWGLAKAAELNGVPGPKHLLEMKEAIGLTLEQEEKIKGIFDNMKAEAVPLGLHLLELEKELDKHFSKGSINEIILSDLLGKIANIHQRLRYVHLAAHLKTPSVLSDEQIAQYNHNRGYTSGVK